VDLDPRAGGGWESGFPRRFGRWRMMGFLSKRNAPVGWERPSDSAARERENERGGRSGCAQHRRTLAQRRAGGQDVVHEEDAAVRDDGGTAHAKGATKVLLPFGAIEVGLRFRRANALQGARFEGEAVLAREGAGEEGGLIEAALAFARGMERHGDDDMDLFAGEMARDAFEKPRLDRRRPKVFLFILEAVQRATDDSAKSNGATRSFELEFRSAAVRAFMALSREPREGQSASFAPWRFEARRRDETGIA